MSEFTGFTGFTLPSDTEHRGRSTEKDGLPSRERSRERTDAMFDRRLIKGIPSIATPDESVQQIREPLKLCLKSGEYSIPNSGSYPVTFLSIAPNFEPDLIDRIQESLFSKSTIDGQFIRFSFKLTRVADNVNVTIINMTNGNLGFGDESDPTSYHALANNLTRYLFSVLHADPSVYFYIIECISRDGQFYIDFDYAKRESAMIAEQYHRDRTNYILICLFRETDEVKASKGTCKFNETTSVALSPRINMWPSTVKELNGLDNPIHDKLTNIFTGPEHSPTLFRFSVPDCVHTTIVIKDEIITHRAPHTGRIRHMFRFKIGGHNGGQFINEFDYESIQKLVISIPIFTSFTEIFRNSLEISIRVPDARDGIYAFNEALLTGTLRIGELGFTVRGGKKTRKRRKKNKKPKRTKRFLNR